MIPENHCDVPKMIEWTRLICVSRYWGIPAGIATTSAKNIMAISQMRWDS